MRIELNEDDLSEAIGLLLHKRGIRGHASVEMRCRAFHGKVLGFSAVATMTEIEAGETEEQR